MYLKKHDDFQAAPGCRRYIIYFILISLFFFLYATHTKAQSIRDIAIKYQYVYDSIKILPMKVNQQYQFDINPSPEPRIYMYAIDTASNVPLIAKVIIEPKYKYSKFDDRDFSARSEGWAIPTLLSTANKYKNTISFSNNPAHYIELEFTGDAFQLIGERDPNHGIMAVTVDSADPVVIDCYAPSIQTQQIMFTKIFKTYGKHKIVIKPTGLKNIAAKAAYIVIDGYIVRY